MMHRGDQDACDVMQRELKAQAHAVGRDRLDPDEVDFLHQCQDGMRLDLSAPEGAADGVYRVRHGRYEAPGAVIEDGKFVYQPTVAAMRRALCGSKGSKVDQQEFVEDVQLVSAARTIIIRTMF